MSRRATLLLGSLVVLGCDSKSTPKDPAEDPQIRSQFEAQVIPILEKDCGSSACHAASDELFAKLPSKYFAYPVDAQGHITGAERIATALERAKAKLSGAGAQFSPFLRKPLDDTLGGLAHRGGMQYGSVRDESYQKLLAWVELARPKEDQPLSRLAQRYAETVQPIFREKRCFQSNCHGSGASNFLVFDQGVNGEFDAEATLHNYDKLLFHLNYETPEAMQARVVKKNIPLEQGGIFHRGGNNFFDPAAGDPDLKVLLDFMKEARQTLNETESGVLKGLVFAATDPTPRHLLDIAAWQPGGDIYTLVPAEPTGKLTNVTQAHHTGPADLRDPAVSYDGRRIAFAMRKTQADCLNLYTMNLDGSDLKQLTFDTGTLPNGVKASNVEPLWGPDDRIYFMSTRSGELADSHWPLSNLWRINADGSGAIRLSYIMDMELSPYWRFYHHQGKDVNQRTLDLTFTAFRGVGTQRRAPLMRVPPDFRADYHPHFGPQNPVYQVFTQASIFDNGRELIILMDEANRWEGGLLALLDRNLGPVIADRGTPAVVNYVDSLQKLGSVGEETAHKGLSRSGYYRDPVALPDGRLVVSHWNKSITHSDTTVRPDPALYRMSLRDTSPNRTFIDVREKLVDLVGKVETDPAPIMVRRREEILDPKTYLKHGTNTGNVLNFDLAVGLTIAREDSPSNTKQFDLTAVDNKYVRLVEEIPFAPTDFPNWPDTSTNRIGRGSHGMRRVLAEFASTKDRSFYLTLPAGVPFFLQSLDHARMTNNTFNQWLFLQPGELLKQVTRREVYNNRCGGCHGAINGDPAESVGKPDVLTQASRVEANYDARRDVDLPPVAHGVNPDERREVDFERDVQPVLTRACATSGCHVAGGRAPNLAARAGAAGFSGPYEALTAAGTFSGSGFSYVDPQSSEARTSYLAEVLVGRDLGAPRTFNSGNCGGRMKLTLMELETLMRWMDLGASFRGIGPKTMPKGYVP